MAVGRVTYADAVRVELWTSILSPDGRSFAAIIDFYLNDFNLNDDAKILQERIQTMLVDELFLELHSMSDVF